MAELIRCMFMVGFALLTAACNHLRPLPVSEPTTLATKGPARGLPPPTDLPTATATLYAYANTYHDEAEGRMASSYRASDVSVAGALLGMVGGLTKSPPAAIAGAGIAGGAGVISQRYALQVQSNNYLGAARAMECMAAVLTYGAPAGGSPEQVQGAAPLDVTSADVDFAFLNDRINDVRRKLRSNLAAIDLSKVDIATLQMNLGKQIDAKRALDKVRPDTSAAESNLRQQLYAFDAGVAAHGITSKEGSIETNRTKLQSLHQQQQNIVQQLQRMQVTQANRALMRSSLATCVAAY